ncbi:MAG: hypothetical protein ABSB35_06830 [Bryobacteraceae bacterium]
MALIYADDVRQKLRSLTRHSKDLWNQWVDKERVYIANITLVRAYRVHTGLAFEQSPDEIDPVKVVREIAQLIREMEELKVRIGQVAKREAALQEQLLTALKRPRIRTQAASIAASGSRAINESANRQSRPSAVFAWDNGISAASHLAEKYKMTRIPDESIEIMSTSFLDRYPGFGLVHKDGPYPSVVKLSTKSVLSK